MRILWHALISLFAFIAGAQAQATKSATPPPALVAPKIAAQSEEAFIPLPPDSRYQVRDLQYHVNQAEIAIQQHQVEIEKLKTQQLGWRDGIANIATDFARIKGLDFTHYEFDQVDLALVKKKTQAPAVVPAPEKK